MKHLKNFLQRLDMRYILGALTELYLLAIIVTNLYCITQADSKLAVAKYAIGTVLALVFASLLAFLDGSQKKDN